MRRSIVCAGLVVVLAGFAALPAQADHVGPHRHFIVTPSGQTVEAGPRVCDNPQAQQGFDNFHENVHTDTPTQHGFQQANNGVELRGGRC